MTYGFRWTSGTAAVVALAFVAPLHAHHSFASYDMTQIKVFTGVVTRVNPDANHLQIYFVPMNEERKNVLRDPDNNPVIWALDMGPSAEMAQQGISVRTFPPGTVFSVGLHPLRNGLPGGFREGPLIRCPGRTTPAPGAHCDTVEGHVISGTGVLPTPTPEK